VRSSSQTLLYEFYLAVAKKSVFSHPEDFVDEQRSGIQASRFCRVSRGSSHGQIHLLLQGKTEEGVAEAVGQTNGAERDACCSREDGKHPRE
jgi:hypothetical protein